MFPEEIRRRFSTRNQYTINLLQFFADSHLHPELKKIVAPLREAVFSIVNDSSDGPELTVAIRRVLDARDAFLRHYLVTHNFTLSPQKPPTDINAPSSL